MSLPSPPGRLIRADGSARFGTYAGPLGPVDLSACSRSALWNAIHHKRWIYTFASSNRHVIAAAVVHLGYAGTAFLAVLDRRTRAMLHDQASFTVPQRVRVGKRCEEGCDVHFRSIGKRVAFTRPLGSSQYTLAVDSSRVNLRLTFETAGAPTPISAVSPVPGGVVNVTSKRVLMPSKGFLRVNEEAYTFDEGWGGMDYTNGLLARRTSWRWAFGMGLSTDGRQVGFNLVDGFNEGRECVVWLGDAVVPLKSVRFDFDPERPLSPWTLTDAEGCLDLRFAGDAMHEERTNLGLIRSSFIQPMGTFSGRIHLPEQSEATLDGISGVVENQKTVW